MTAATPVPVPRQLSLPEFTALLAALFATVAFSIDSMLPALPQIAAELSPGDVNRAQLILTVFVAGMGTGMLFAGPISDAVGRKRTILGGLVIYMLAALLSHQASSLGFLLAARFVQGCGAAAPRIVGLAVVRDLHSGRQMARVVSFVSTVFLLIPAVAPSIGAAIVGLWGWRAQFLVFVAFALTVGAWLSIRQPETLPPERRRALSAASLIAAAREVLSDREVRAYSAVMTLGLGQMFALLSSAQQLFGETFGRQDSFPKWFAVMALLASVGALTNSRLVMRVGMRKLAMRAYLAQAIFSVVVVGVFKAGILTGTPAFALFFVWATSIFAMAGLTFGNVQALSMHKMGHIAGMAASIVGAISTVLAAVVAAPIGLAFDGTPVPVMLGAAIASTLAFVLMAGTRNAG